MKIEKVTYQHPFVIGPYLQEKVGFEAALDEGEDPKEALTALKAIAAEWHKESNPGWAAPQQEMGSGPMGAPVINRKAERLMILIENSTTAEELKGYAEDVARLSQDDPHIDIAYYRKLKELLQ